MRNNFWFFSEQDGRASGVFRTDPLMLHSLSGNWLYNIVSFIDNSQHLYVHGSLALQEAFACMSNFSGALVLWLASGSNRGINSTLPGGSSFSHSKCCAQVLHISSISCDLVGFSCKERSKRRSLFWEIPSLPLNKLLWKAEWIQSFPVLSLAIAMVPPFTNVATNILVIPQNSGFKNAQICVDQMPDKFENNKSGHVNDLFFRNFDLTTNIIEPKTGIEFPKMLDNGSDGENISSFPPEVLVGTGSRIMTIIKIKSLKVYAFGFYVHPFDVYEKLGPKYSSITENELNKCREFYQDLLREDINMTVRLVINCNGIKISTVKDAFGKSLRDRLAKTNPDADFSCLQAFGSLFSQDIPLHVGTIINFRRTADGHLITEVGGNHIGAVQSKDLCRAFFDMYIGDLPVSEQAKEEIGKNVASIIQVY